MTVDAPIDEFQGYRPGLEADAALGAYYTGLTIHGVGIHSNRAATALRGAGIIAAPTGCAPDRIRISTAPAFARLGTGLPPLSIYADVEVPVYQHFSGDQLTAPLLFKVIMTYHF